MLRKAIFWIFHPLWMLGLALVTLLWVDPYAYGKDPVLMVLGAGMLAFILPAAALGMMRMLKLGIGKDNASRLDQIGPLLIVAVFYLWLFRNLYSNPEIDSIAKEWVLGALIALFLGFFINLFEKVPFHAVGLGFMLAVNTLLHYQSYDTFAVIYRSATVFEINTIFFPVFWLLATSVACFTGVLDNNQPKKWLGPYFTGMAGPFFATWII